MTHICIGNLSILVSDNGLSPGQRQTIIWTNAGIVLIGPLRTKFSENLIEIHSVSFKKIHLKMLSAKWWPFLSWPQCVNFFHEQRKGQIVSTELPDTIKSTFSITGNFATTAKDKFSKANNFLYPGYLISAAGFWSVSSRESYYSNVLKKIWTIYQPETGFQCCTS